MDDLNIIKNKLDKIIYKQLYEQKCKEIDELMKKLKLLEINNKKGQLCSINGNKYEKQIFNIVNKCLISDSKQLFNTQKIEELGGSTLCNDIECNYIDKKIGIEIKKYNSPDWMQCSIIYNKKDNKWEPSTKGKIPIESRNIFKELLNNISLYNNQIPPFLEKKLTYEEWLTIKSNTTNWDDIYLNIPNDTIKNLYNKKNCQYIQISNNYGLYHLGDDICNFDVPIFLVEQQMRIRIKVHTKKNKNGFCNLSIMAACQPKNIKTLEKSKYSLDDVKNLPINLTYNN